MTETAFTIAMDARSRTEILEERFDRHMDKMEKAIEKLDQKLDAQSAMELRLTQAINKVQIDSLQADNKVNLKLYGIFGAIASGVYGMAEGLKHLFK